jgi:hypothetical protein
MELSEAWAVLGKDVNQLFHGTLHLPDIESKMAAVDKAFRIAERSAKKLLGQNHPDKNPGDPEAAERYQRILSALEVIKDHTEKFREKVSGILDRRENPPDGHIQIG